MARNHKANGSTILRVRKRHEISDEPVCRVTGYLNPANFLALFEAADLTANPRLPRVNAQVRDMWDAIELKPDAFHLKNNGILIAASSCESLERDRYRVGFDPADSEAHPRGILNGGHTALACAASLVRQAADRNDAKPPRFRMWDEFRNEVWPDWSTDVAEIIDGIEEFLVPVEILYPAEGATETYDALIHEIADARNNNCELTEEAKANHAGYYKELKAAMPNADIRNAIEWKTNTPGTRINAKDVVALACVPLSQISEEVAGFKIDLKQVYNSTSKCSSYFSKVYQQVSTPQDAVRVLKDDDAGRLVASAISLTGELVELYDWLQTEFTRAYNRAGGAFGGIEGMKGESGGRQYRTRFSEALCDFKYSDGFFMPILTSVVLLIERDGNQLRWSKSPRQVIERHLDRMMTTYKGMVKDKGYDGRVIGRDQTSYDHAHSTLSMLLDLEDALQQQGS